MPTAPLPRRTLTLLLLALVAAAAVTYLPTLDNHLVYDDLSTVQRNPLIASFSRIPAQFTSAMWDIVEPTDRHRVGYWRPLMNVALTFANVWGSGSARAFHLLSILLHAGAVCAAFALAWRLVKNVSIAFFAALLFALHPVQVESVAWVSSLNSMLFGMFALFALERYLAWRERGSKGAPWSAGACFLFALLSKELAIAVVPAVVVLEVARFLSGERAKDAPPTSFARSWLPYAPFAAAFVAYYVARAAVFGSPLAGFDIVTTEYGFDAQRMALLRVELFGGFLALLAWPNPLVFFRPVQPDLTATSATLLPAWCAILVCAALIVFAWKKRAWLPLAALGLAVAGILPQVAGVKSAGIFPLSERYLYFAVFGAALLAAWTAFRFLPRAVATLLLVVVSAVFGARSFARAKTWRDDSTLFTTAIEQTTSSPYVWWVYGRTELELYKAAAKDPTAGAVEHLNTARGAFERALELGNRAQHGDGSILAVGSDFVQANVGLAWTLLYEAEIDGYHDFDTPIQVLRNVVRRYPGEESAQTALGVALQHVGRFDEAEKAFQEALTINPLFPESWQSLGLVRLKRGNVSGAVTAFEKALALRPEHLDYVVWLARAEAENGHADRALELLQRAAERNPDASAPLVWRATILAQRGQFDEAIELARRALELDPDDGEAYLLKGRLHARVNETQSAERAFVRATELLPRSFEANYNAAAVLLQNPNFGVQRAMPFLVTAYQLRPPGAAGDTLRDTLRRLEIAEPDVLWELASADAAREDVDGALDWIGRALSKKSDHGPSHYLKAFLLKKKGDVEGAIANWTLACNELPKSVPARTSLAGVLVEQQRFADAAKWLQEAYDLAKSEQGREEGAQAALEELRQKLDDVRAKAAGK
ncbi:MAG: tetratricopeptide repeat protein [Planctomycetota bacterium]